MTVQTRPENVSKGRAPCRQRRKAVGGTGVVGTWNRMQHTSEPRRRGDGRIFWVGAEAYRKREGRRKDRTTAASALCCRILTADLFSPRSVVAGASGGFLMGPCSSPPPPPHPFCCPISPHFSVLGAPTCKLGLWKRLLMREKEGEAFENS